MSERYLTPELLREWPYDPSPKSFQRVMELNRKLVVKKPIVDGLENRWMLHKGERPVIAFLHGTSNTDAQIAASVLGKYFNIAIAGWSTNFEMPHMRVGMNLAGLEQFYPISVSHRQKSPEKYPDERYTINPEDYDRLTYAMVEEGKVPMIAAQRRRYTGELYRNSGFGAPLLAQLSGSRVVLPVCVDIDYRDVVKGLVDLPKTVIQNWLRRSRPQSYVYIDEPMRLEPISYDDLKTMMDVKFGGVKPMGDQQGRADRTYTLLRSQGDEILMRVGSHFPPERQGMWRERIQAKYPYPLEHQT